MKVLIDTNIILDFFLEREPFFQLASEVFEAMATERTEFFSRYVARQPRLGGRDEFRGLRSFSR